MLPVQNYTIYPLSQNFITTIYDKTYLKTDEKMNSTEIRIGKINLISDGVHEKSRIFAAHRI